MHLKLFSLIFLIIFALILGQNETNIETGPQIINHIVYESNLIGLFSTDSELPIDNQIINAALILALEEANKRFPRIKFHLTSKIGNQECLRNNGGAYAAELYYNSRRSISAIIGPACSSALNSVGRMASTWNLPVFTAGGIEDIFTNKNIYSSLVRLFISLDSISEFFIKILTEFDWHHLSLIVNEDDPLMILFRNSILQLMKKLKFTSTYNFRYEIIPFDLKNVSRAKYENILKSASKYARVFIFLTSGNILRNMLLEAYELGMDNGDYAFFGIELIKNKKKYGDFSWYKQGDYRNREAKKMFEALMIVAVRVPTSPEYVVFQHEIIKLINKNSNITFTIDDINPISATFYDSLLMYAFALNQTLELKEDPKNAKNLINKITNKIYYGGLTGDIFINSNGDRQADFTLNDLDAESGNMQPVATFFGIKRSYEKVNGLEISWLNRDNPPPDVPNCGFTNDAPYCLPQKEFSIFTIILVVILVLIIIASVSAFYIYEKVKYDNSLDNIWWKVDWEDLEFVEDKLNRKSKVSVISETSYLSKTTFSTIKEDSNLLNTGVTSINTSTLLTLGIKVAMYKNVKVGVKILNIKKLNLNRELMVELKQMKECMHENLLQFIGICSEAPNYAIVTELSIRGTLNDMLQNPKTNIDWVFKYSIITDIVEGLCFIHSSAIGHHGKLKSTNCLIDSRFLIKISDYNMRNMHSQMENKFYNFKPDKANEGVEDDQNDINLRDLFWTSPEHLREKQPEKTLGSKKGDVYSFAIILQEIITRCGPFETVERSGRKNENLKPDEIIDKIKMCLNPPFRPKVASDEAPIELLDLMKRCWHEDPNQRYDFNTIKIKLKKITKGISSKNFIDNLLNRMEQYANNLEQLIEEKTSLLIEEKQKADEILYQLLPKSIANQLKSGLQIEPEVFDVVTIFFSDIVGFTSLSAASTPMQVVNFLNELYVCFDAIIAEFDVYKVETIGDAYMVVSGLPERNNNDHAREIARMALKLRDATKNFVIKYKPDHKLQIRIGIHSGPVVAGVVGTKMPRYCLFGESVNLASKMESHSEPLKIHITEATKLILDGFFSFVIELRGNIEIKGIGNVTTYWLLKEN